MNTLTNAYLTKFSSGTIAALLIFSGLLFLVPFAAPASAAQNVSLPVFGISPNALVAGGATAVSLSLTNPSTNAYSITSVTFVAPTGWSFSTPPTCSSVTGWTAGGISTSAVQCVGGSLAPGFSLSFTGAQITPPASPATSAPVTGSFTTSLIDSGSSPAAYTGPSFSEYSIAATTVAVTASSTSFTAGGSAITITATLSSAQPGVPITWTVTTAPHAGFKATLSPTSGLTSATGTATTLFAPSNYATDATTITATIGVGGPASASPTITTFAAAPSTVTFMLGANPFPSNHYVTTSVTISTKVYADIPSGSMSFTAADAFGNPTCASVTAGTVSAANGFLNGVTTTTSYAVTTCTTINQYDQASTFGTVGQVSVTLTGTGFSVSGASGFIQTSTFATTASFTTPAAPANVGAGKTQVFTMTLGTVQSGVPVKIQLCTSAGCSSKKYSGLFSNGATSISGTTGTSGTFSGTLTVSTLLGAVAVVNATVTAPVDGSTNPQSFTSSNSPAITTIAGAPAAFQVYTTFGSDLPHPGPVAKYGTAGATLYVAAILTDAYGNVVTNPSPQQIQITMVPSGGLLSATSVYISTLSSRTNDTISFGYVAWTLPTTLGTYTVTATAVVTGVQATGISTVTTVSNLPTISVKSPTPVNGYIYTNNLFVTFSGKANASLGYPSTVTINSIGYKVGTGKWQTASVAPLNQIVWSIPVTLSTGLSTVQFNATDSSTPKNVATTSVYQVLVDTASPIVTAVTASGSTLSNGAPVQFTITEPLGDLNATAVTATYGGNTVAASGITVTGTNNLGSSVTYSVNVAGIAAGTWTVTLTAKSLTKTTGSASTIVTIVVPLNQSFTISGTPTKTTLNGQPTVLASWTNNLATSTTAIVYMTVKNSAGATVYITTATLTLGAGATGPSYLVITGLVSGTYTVNIFVVNTSGVGISQSTTTTVSF